MTFEQFDKFQDELFKEVIKMRDTKGKDYAHNADRFANFNRAAARKGISPLMVASIYMDKHLDAIDAFIGTGKTESSEPLYGRFVDAICYLTLIAGMIQEETDKSYNQVAYGSLNVKNVANNLDQITCTKCGIVFTASNQVIFDNNKPYHHLCYYELHQTKS